MSLSLLLFKFRVHYIISIMRVIAPHYIACTPTSVTQPQPGAVHHLKHTPLSVANMGPRRNCRYALPQTV